MLAKQQLSVRQLLLTAEDLVARSIPEREASRERGRWLYFLIERDLIIYVGRTCNIAGRLKAHRRSKNFSKVAILPDDGDLEKRYIQALDPELNIKCKLSKSAGPAQRDKLNTLDGLQTTTVVLERIHRDLIRIFASRYGLSGRSEAVREIIVRYFNIKDSRFADARAAAASCAGMIA